MKKLGLFLAVALLILVSAGTSMAAIVTFDGSEYQFVSASAINWTDAASAAWALGSGWHLVTITSAAEQNFVAGMLGNMGGLVWAGGYQYPNMAQHTEGWQWVTDPVDAWGYTSWATLPPGSTYQEPNNWAGADENYLALDGRTIVVDSVTYNRNWTWNDDLVSDSAIKGYVAERAAPVPEPGTMMLLGSGLVGLAGWGRKRFRK